MDENRIIAQIINPKRGFEHDFSLQDRISGRNTYLAVYMDKTVFLLCSIRVSLPPKYRNTYKEVKVTFCLIGHIQSISAQ